MLFKICIKNYTYFKVDKQYNKTIGPIKYRIQKGIVTNWSSKPGKYACLKNLIIGITKCHKYKQVYTKTNF